MKRITIDRKNQNSNKTGEKCRKNYIIIAELKEYIKNWTVLRLHFQWVDSTFYKGGT